MKRGLKDDKGRLKLKTLDTQHSMKRGLKVTTLYSLVMITLGDESRWKEDWKSSLISPHGCLSNSQDSMKRGLKDWSCVHWLSAEGGTPRWKEDWKKPNFSIRKSTNWEITRWKEDWKINPPLASVCFQNGFATRWKEDWKLSPTILILHFILYLDEKRIERAELLNQIHKRMW